jgi:hypothetical protein
VKRETEADFVECTTRAKTKRHWSEIPHAQWGLRPLCGSTPWGLSQAEVDEQMPPKWRKRTVIIALPACKQCDKSRQRRLDGRPS